MMNHTRTAELFDRVWNEGTYRGFSQGTPGERETPFLLEFIGQAKRLRDAKARIAELGAGSGDHSLRLALEGFEVTAVEYSHAAVTQLQDRIAGCPELAPRIRAERKNLFEYAAGLSANCLEGIYANSVLHFLTFAERRQLYRTLHGALTINGVLGISFKGHGDALQARGRVVDAGEAGQLVEGTDGIRRLFVSDPSPLADELRECGYRVGKVIRWSVPGYNIDGEEGQFVGLIAARLGAV